MFGLRVTNGKEPMIIRVFNSEKVRDEIYDLLDVVRCNQVDLHKETICYIGEDK